MSGSFVPEQVIRLRRDLVPSWEDRIHRILSATLKIEVNYRSLETAGPRHAEALATLCCRGGERVLGSVHDAVRRICVADPSGNAAEAIATRVAAVEIRHSQDWLEMGAEMVPVADAGRRGPGEDAGAAERAGADEIDELRRMWLARQERYRLVITGALDMGSRGVVSEPTLRGVIAESLGLAGRDLASEVRQDVRPVWEERLRLACGAPAARGGPPFVIHWDSFASGERPDDALRSLQHGYGRLVFARIAEAVRIVCGGSMAVRKSLSKMLHHVQIKSCGVNTRKMKVHVREAYLRTDHEAEQYGRGHRASVVLPEKVEPYMKVGRRVHVLKIIGAFELGDAGCHTVNDYLYVLHRAYKPKSGGRPAAREVLLDESNDYVEAEVMALTRIEGADDDRVSTFGGDLLRRGVGTGAVPGGGARRPSSSSAAAATAAASPVRGRSRTPRGRGRSRRGASVSFAGAEERSFRAEDPALDVSRGDATFDDGDSSEDTITRRNRRRSRSRTNDDTDGEYDGDDTDGDGPAGAGGGRGGAYRSWAAMRSASRSPSAARSRSRSRSHSLASSVASDPDRFLSKFEQSQVTLSEYEGGQSIFDEREAYHATQRRSKMTSRADPNRVRRTGRGVDPNTHGDGVMIRDASELDHGLIGATERNVIPHWEQRIARDVGVDVPIAVKWDTFVRSSDPDGAIAVIADGEGEYTMERTAAALHRLCDENPRWRDRIADGLVRVNIKNAATLADRKCLVRPAVRDGDHGARRRRESGRGRDGDRDGDGDGDGTSAGAREEGEELVLSCHFDSGADGCFSSGQIEDALRDGFKLGKREAMEELTDEIIPSWERRVNLDLLGRHRVAFKVEWDTFLDARDKDEALATLVARDGALVFGRIVEAVHHICRSDPKWRDILADRLAEIRISHAVGRKERMRLEAVPIGRSEDVALDVVGVFGFGELGCYTEKQYRRALQDALDLKSRGPDLEYLRGEIENEVIPPHVATIAKAARLRGAAPSSGSSRSGGRREDAGDFEVVMDWDSFCEDPRDYKPAVETVHSKLGRDALAPASDAIAAICRENDEWRDAIREGLGSVVLVNGPSRRTEVKRAPRVVQGREARGKDSLVLEAPYHEGPRACATNAQVRQALISHFNLGGSSLARLIKKIKFDVVPEWDKLIVDAVRKALPGDVAANRSVLKIRVDWDSITSASRGENAAMTLLAKTAGDGDRGRERDRDDGRGRSRGGGGSKGLSEEEQDMDGSLVFGAALAAVRAVIDGNQDAACALNGGAAELCFSNAGRASVSCEVENQYLHEKRARRERNRDRDRDPRRAARKPVYGGLKWSIHVANQYEGGRRNVQSTTEVADGVAFAVMQYERKRCDKRVAPHFEVDVNEAAGSPRVPIELRVDWPTLGFRGVGAGSERRRDGKSRDKENTGRGRSGGRGDGGRGDGGGVRGASAELRKWQKMVATVSGSRKSCAFAQFAASAKKAAEEVGGTSREGQATVSTILVGHAERLEETIVPAEGRGAVRGDQRRDGSSSRAGGSATGATLRVCADLSKGERSFADSVSVAHAVRAAHLPPRDRLSSDQAKVATRMMEEAGHIVKAGNGDPSYITWLASHPCYYQPDDKARSAIEAATTSRLTSGSDTLVKGWVLPKIGKDDRVKDRVVLLTDKWLYVIPVDSSGRVESKRTSKEATRLNEILFVQRGDFHAKGSLSSGRRRGIVDSTSGVRIHLASSSGERANAQLIERLSEKPKRCITLMGHTSRATGDKAALEEQRASSAELAALVEVVADSRTSGALGSKNSSIPRKPKFGTGLRSVGFNSSQRGRTFLSSFKR